MPSIFIEISVPDLIRDRFETEEFRPFGRLILTYAVDTDEGQKIIEALMYEVKYQKQRNEKLLAERSK
jgi:hypothetical protein